MVLLLDKLVELGQGEGLFDVEGGWVLVHLSSSLDKLFSGTNCPILS